MPVPEDIYKTDVDFTALALQYKDFSKKLKSNRQLDFSDPESVRQLTKALLHRDFNLTIDLPEDRLCPPVPNRFNYILFAQRLTDATQLNYDEEPSSSRLIGLDIGTGASAIYPLLACRQRSEWAFLATEIDQKSKSYAERNINTNQLGSRIRILDTDLSGQQLIPTAALQRFDDYDVRIQITNPPFYSSEAEMIQSAKQKSRPPNSACTGASVEMIVEGGEVAFVSRLVEESMVAQNKTRIQWFSSMLGKLSSVGQVIEKLKDANCTNYAATELIQGQKTRRWCVAWSWISIRPPTTLARGIPSLDNKYMPFPAEFEFGVDNKDPDAVGTLIDAELSKLDLHWSGYNRGKGVGRSMTGDVWSRRARRKKQHDQEMKDIEDNGSTSSDQDNEPALAFRVTVQPDNKAAYGSTRSHIHVRWLQGRDHVLFESFCGWLKRKVQL